MTLSCVYDLRMAPVSFDFSCYLAVADCARQLLGHDTFTVTVLADGFRQQTQRDIDTPIEEKVWRIHGILMDLVALYPKLTGINVTAEPTARDFDWPEQYPNHRTPYVPVYVKQLYEQGADPRGVVEAPLLARQAAPSSDVVLSLRLSHRFGERNASIHDWGRFHDELVNKHLQDVIVIPDQENMEACREWDWNLYEPAAYDIRLRYGAYSNTGVVFCSAHGPNAPLYFTDIPYIMFDHLRGNVITAEKYNHMFGFPIGQQFPWSTKYQTLTWTNSTFPALCLHYQQLRDTLSGEEAA